MQRLGSVRIGAAALLASTAIDEPSLALPLTDTERQVPDGNGVDVISGKLAVPLRSVTIGSADSSLTYLNGWTAGATYDTFSVTISGLGSQDTSPLITIFGQTKRFNKNADGSWSDPDGEGATFIFDSAQNAYIYTDREGTVFTFPKSNGDTGFLPLTLARVSTIKKANGEVLTFSWHLEPGFRFCDPSFNCIFVPAGGRVRSVNSNLGFQLKPSYATNTWYTNGSSNADWSRLTKVTAINNAVDYCDPQAYSCTYTKAWPEVTIGTSTNGSTTTRTFTDRLSQTTTVVSNANNVTSVTLPASGGATQTITYDANNRVYTLSKGGGSWGYTYVDNGTQRTTTVTQPGGGSKIYISDLNLKRLLSFTNELGRITSFQYDSFGRVTRRTMPEGNYVQLTYDARGNVTETRSVAKAGSGLADIVTSAGFDATCANIKKCNKPNSTTDARGNTTDYVYDSNHGGVTSITSPAPSTGAVRPQTRYSYTSLSAYYKNSSGAIVAAPSPVTKLTGISACQTLASCAGAADETKSTLTYGTPGVANNLYVTAQSSGSGNGSLTATTAATYDEFGNTKTIDGPLSGAADTTTYFYDADRQLTKVASADPDGAGSLPHRARQITYNGDGRVTRIDLGTMTQSGGVWSAVTIAQSVNRTYDNLGRPLKDTLTTGPLLTPVTHAVTQYSYDTKGRLDCTATRMNSAIFGSLPASACTLGTTGSLGPDRIAKNIYNPADQLTQQQVAVGTTDQASEATFTYTNNGKPQTLKDAENNLTTDEYDGHDRLSKTRFPVAAKGGNASSTTDYEQLSYDAAGNVTNLRLRDAQNITFTYDKLNRATFKDLPGSEPDVTYGYDNLGRLTSASQTGHSLTLTYDALSRQLSEAGPIATVSYEYDLAGRKTRLSTTNGYVLNYQRLVTGEMATILEGGGAPMASYVYDNLGRHYSLTYHNGVIVWYAWDPVSRLGSTAHDLAGGASDVVIDFTYNPASEMVTRTRNNDAYAWTGHYNENRNYSSNGLNQLTASGAITPTYDARGNLTSAGNTTYSYTSENMLVSAAGGTSATLSYDPLGRLYQLSSRTSVRRFLYATGESGIPEAISEYDGSNQVTHHHGFGPGADEPILWWDLTQSPWPRGLHADERGSIVSVTDDSGNLLTINSYDEYGIPGTANAGRLQYTGQMWLPELGMAAMTARCGC